jgi:hypothetical protein
MSQLFTMTMHLETLSLHYCSNMISYWSLNSFHLPLNLSKTSSETLNIHKHPSNIFGRIDNVSLTIGGGAESWYGECCVKLFGYLSSLWNCWCLCYVSMICMYSLWAVSKWGMMCSLFTEVEASRPWCWWYVKQGRRGSTKRISWFRLRREVEVMKG